MVPDDASRTNAPESLFTANVRLALGDGLLSESRDAAALYLAPGTEITNEAVAAAGPSEVLAGYGAETAEQLGRFLAALGGMHTAATPGPHWQLFFLGVHPAVQGTGLGVALVDEENRGRCATASPFTSIRSPLATSASTNGGLPGRGRM